MTSGPTTWRSDAQPDRPITSPLIVVFCALAFWLVAQGFVYLDRRFGQFGMESLLWSLWTLLGFGIGAWACWRQQAFTRAHMALVFIACFVALLPGFLLFSLLRWVGFSLLLVTAARAAAMRVQRDFYFCMGTIVAVSLLVATHPSADWSVWFYLLPAWGCLGLALAWEYTADVPLNRWLKSGLTIGFLLICTFFAAVLFALVPKPGIGHFGFLPPGVEIENAKKSDGSNVDSPQQGGSGGAPDKGARASPNEQRLQFLKGSVLGRSLLSIRQALDDPHLPDTQRLVFTAVLRATGIKIEPDQGRLSVQGIIEMEYRVIALSEFIRNTLRGLFLLVVTAIAAWGLWRQRWRLAVESALVAAWASAARWPGLSIRCAATGARWLMRRHGHKRARGWSLREYVAAAPTYPEPGNAWFRQFAETYGAHRFGEREVTTAVATDLHQRVAALAELLRAQHRGRALASDVTPRGLR